MQKLNLKKRQPSLSPEHLVARTAALTAFCRRPVRCRSVLSGPAPVPRIAGRVASPGAETERGGQSNSGQSGRCGGNHRPRCRHLCWNSTHTKVKFLLQIVGAESLNFFDRFPRGVPYPVPFITIVRDGSNFPGGKNVGSASLHSTVGQFLVESHYLNFT